MRIAVLGAGAVGLSVAARLSQVADVVAVTRERCVAAIRQDGFHLSGRWGDGVYDLAVTTRPDPDEEFDYVFVTAKSVDTAAVCREFAPVLARSEAVSLQNGIGNEEIIAGVADRVIGGMIITGFEWRSDSAVHVSVEGGPMKLGRFPAGTDSAVEALVDLVRQAGIPVEGTAAIRSEIWGKTMYNCALNPLGALMNVPYGRLAESHAWTVIGAIVTEVYAVAGAEGISQLNAHDVPEGGGEAEVITHRLALDEFRTLKLGMNSLQPRPVRLVHILSQSALRSPEFGLQGNRPVVPL